MNSAYEMIIDRNKCPLYSGTLVHPTIKRKESNPLCGDEIELFIGLDGKTIQDIKFRSKGCSISKAGVDLLCEYVIGKTTTEALAISKEEIVELLGIEVRAMRMKCA